MATDGPVDNSPEPVRQPVHESDVEWACWYEGTDREIRGKALCDEGGRARVGFGVLELPPGCNTRPAHWHSREEEHVYALEGEATLHLGDTAHALKPGSYVCFPAGQAVAHYIENVSDRAFRYIIVGERIAEDQVTHVP